VYRRLRSASGWLTAAALVISIGSVAGCDGAHRVTSRSGSLSGSISVVLKPPCVKTVKSQTAMDQCAALWLTKSRSVLARALVRERTKLPAKSVNAAQAAWVAYRSAECSAEAAPYRGGSIYPLIYLNCEVDLTNARSAQIQHVIANLPH
jgi:uncharacterized protein YecT (DUF1311 family)